jgi:hypothetical protein
VHIAFDKIAIDAIATLRLRPAILPIRYDLKFWFMVLLTAEIT